MKVLIAIHQCHFDGKAGKRMVAEPMEQFEVADDVAAVLVKAGAAKEVEAEVVDKPEAKTTAKATTKPAAKGKAGAAKSEEPKSDAEGKELI